VINQDRNKAWGFSLFGDDVRVEVGGKLSLVETYQSDMFFPNSMPLPILLPKISIVVMYYEIHDAIQEDLSFKVTYGPEKTLLAELPVSRKDILEGQSHAPPPPSDLDDEDNEKIFNIRMPINLSPFRVDQMGGLRVRAHYSDGKILKLGSLWLKQIPETDFQNMLGIKPS
jgi:hypothetical protein